MHLVFDSSSLISVGQSCLIEVLHSLQERIGAQFVIPHSVFKEVVKRPMHIKRFELNAVRLKKAVDEGWLQVRALGAKNRSAEIVQAANNCFFSRGRAITLLQRGEVEALALALELETAALVIDERTTRMLVEAPFKLRDLMESRHRAEISVDNGNVKRFQGMFRRLEIVRSVELIALSFELGLLGEELQQNRQALHAALYAAKFGGCAVSSKEINEFLQGV